MTRSDRATLSSHSSYRALTAIPVLAATLTALTIAPASAQQEFRKVYNAPLADSTTTVIVAPTAPPPSMVVITPVAPSTAVIPATPDNGASVIVSQTPPAPPSVAVIPSQSMSAPTVIAVPSASQTTQFQPTEVIAPLRTPPAAEIITPAAAVAASMDWQAGHWESNGLTRSYVPGQYVPRPQVGSVWVPGRWQQTSSDDPYSWVAGHWS